MRTRISYPTVYDLADVIDLLKILLKSSLPLSSLCDNKKIKDEFQRSISQWRKKHGINIETITFVGILDFMGKRKFEAKDASSQISDLNLTLMDVFRELPVNSIVNFLTPKGIQIALSSDPRFLLFCTILTNKVLPDYFAKSIQCHKAYSQTIQLEDLEKELHIPSRKKRPEGKCIIKWFQFFTINVEENFKFRLHKNRTIHFLIFCIKNKIEQLLLNQGIKAFKDVRSEIMTDLRLDSSFPFDEVFEIIYRYQNSGNISFRSGRERFIGGWKGDSNFAFIELKSGLKMPSFEFVSTIADSSRIELGVETCQTQI